MMQDQQPEKQQEHRLVAGNAITGVAPSHKPTTISPSTPRYERKHDYAYYKGIFCDRPMPFAFLDLDLLEQNIRQVVALAQGKRVRLAEELPFQYEHTTEADMVRRLLSNPRFCPSTRLRN